MSFKARRRTEKTDLFVVVHANGNIMQSLFTTEAMAKRIARHEGDSVVAVHVDLTKEPIFIRSKKL